MGTFLGTGGEHNVADPGLGGATFRHSVSLSAKCHVPGDPGREITCAGTSSRTSLNLVGFLGGCESIT
jgi:hypothetical protein